MEGDDRIRFCSDCKLNVYNLSGMTRVEAEELVATREGRLCVTFIRRFDGTIITKDCQTIVGRVKDSFRFVASFIAAIMSGASLLTACSQPVTPTTGQVCERDPMNTPTARKTVFVVKNDISAGDKISKDTVEEKLVPPTNVPSNAATALEHGSIARYDIEGGSVLSTNDIVEAQHAVPIDVALSDNEMMQVEKIAKESNKSINEVVTGWVRADLNSNQAAPEKQAGGDR